MKITIEISDENDAAEACREVANAIDAGYRNGFIGWSCDTWSLEED